MMTCISFRVRELTGMLMLRASEIQRGERHCYVVQPDLFKAWTFDVLVDALKSTAVIIFCCIHLTNASAADSSEIMSANEARVANNGISSIGIAKVDPFNGNLTSKVQELYLPGSGGLDISIYRLFDSARLRSKIWDGTLMDGAYWPFNWRLEWAAFGDSGWILGAVPIVHISVAKRYNNDLPMDMSDGLNKICTGQAFRSNGTSGLYGTVIVYTLVLPDGTEEALVPLQTGVVQSRGGWRLTCVGGQGGTHILQDPNGEKYILGKRIDNGLYSPAAGEYLATLSFAATRREDLNGNFVEYSYIDVQERGAPRARLSGISASDGRSVSLFYEYDVANLASRLQRIDVSGGGSTSFSYAGGKLSAVSDSVGRSWAYEYYPNVPYDSQQGLASLSGVLTQIDWAKSGHLKKISAPSGGNIDIQYEPSKVLGTGVWWWDGDASQLEQNSSPDLLDYRANWSLRVKTRSTSDSGVWQYAYAPGSDQGQYDVTTINTPVGVEIHKFIGESYFVTAAQFASSGYVFNYATLDSSLIWKFTTGAWKLGLPVEVSYGTRRTEMFDWDYRVHSSIYYAATNGHVGLRDDMTLIPKLVRKTVVLEGISYISEYSNYDTYGNVGAVLERGPVGTLRTSTRTYYTDGQKNILHRVKDESILIN